MFSDVNGQEIKTVKLMKNNIRNEHLEDNLSELGLFAQLELIDLSHNRAISAATVVELLDRVPSIKDVTLHGTGVQSAAEFSPHYHHRITLQQ